VKSAARDAEILKTIRPGDLAAYLRARHWALREHYENRESFWTHDADPLSAHELLLPLRTEFKDYALRISEALETLEVVEGRPRDFILKDIMTAIFDVVRVRVENPNSRDGSIGLDDGVALFENARKMVTSAARSTYRASPQFVTGMPEEVADYLRKVRVGQTERGSYVVNILSPVIPDTEQDQLFSTEPYELEDSFERRVMQTLSTGLEAAHTAARESVQDPYFKKFEEAVPRGVSANLCEAIADIGKSGESSGVEVDLRWALARPVHDQVDRRVYFPAFDIPIIEEAGRRLRSTPSREERIQGYVTRLSREKGLGGEGTITIVSFIDDKLRRITVELRPTAYQRAVRAHEQDQPVVCYGRLERRGKSFFLRNARKLQIVADTEENLED
jgi:hypothetical protein